MIAGGLQDGYKVTIIGTFLPQTKTGTGNCGVSQPHPKGATVLSAQKGPPSIPSEHPHLAQRKARALASNARHPLPPVHSIQAPTDSPEKEGNGGSRSRRKQASPEEEVLGTELYTRWPSVSDTSTSFLPTAARIDFVGTSCGPGRGHI